MATKKYRIEKHIAAIIVIVIIAVLMVYYLLVYVPENERALKSLGLRTMRTIALNCSEKYRHYPSSLASAPAEYTAKWIETNFPKDSVQCDNGQLKLVQTDDKTKTGRFDGYGEPLLKPDTSFAISKTDHNPGRLHDNFLFYSVYKVDILNSKIKSSLEKWGIQKNSFPFVVSIRDYMENLKRYDFFDDIFLLGDHEGDLPTAKHLTIQHVLDDSRLGLIHYEVPSNLFHKGIAIYLDSISGEPYLAFHQRVKLDSALELSLVGLVSKKTFDQRAREVPNWLLTFIILGLLLLVQIWPLLKLFLLSKEEKLRSLDVQFTTFSVVFIVSFTTVLLIGAFTFLGPHKQTIKDTLQRISQEMNTGFDHNIEERKKYVSNFCFGCFDPGVHNYNLPDMSYNELFTVRVDGTAYGNMQTLLVEKGRSYPDLCPTHSNSKRNVRTRDYFKIPADALRSGVHLKPYIQSLISRSTGALECAVAIQSRDSDENLVKVITSFLPSVIKPVLPAGYTFAVLDKNGKVQFHSDQSKVKNENAFDECESSNTLRSYVMYGSSGFLSLRYAGKDCIMYCAPMSNDWYLIIFYNWEATRSIAATVFILCLGSLITVLLFIITLHIFFRLDKPNFRVLEFRPFFFQWLNPLTISKAKLNFLILAFLTMAVAHLLWMWAGHSVAGTFLWSFLITSMCYGIAYSTLRPMQHTEKKKAKIVMATPKSRLTDLGKTIPHQLLKQLRHLTHFEWALLVTIVIISGLFVVNAFAQENTFSQLVLVLGTLAAFLMCWNYGWQVNVGVISGDSPIPSRYSLYRIFLTCCLLNLAILPATKFFYDHLLHEDIVRTREGLRREIVQQQIRSSAAQKDYIGKKRPANYTDTTNIRSECPRDTLSYFAEYDNRFYQETQKYFGKDELTYQGLLSEKPSKQDSIEFWLQDAMVVAQAPHNFLQAQDKPWPIFAKRLYPLYTKSSLSVLAGILIVFVILFYLLWLALYQIPNRIFYLPLQYSPDNAAMLQAYPGGSSSRTPGDTFSQPMIEQLNEFVSEAGNATFNVQSNSDKSKYEVKIIDLQRKYHSLLERVWKTCSTDEKYFLFDLAEDGIVNQGDRRILKQLVDKKLVRDIPRLEMAAAPLTNFVLTEMSPDDRQDMEEAARKEGRWSNWRLPLILLIFATLAFLSFIQEDFMARVSALIGSITVILPRLISMSTDFGRLFARGKGTMPKA